MSDTKAIAKKMVRAFRCSRTGLYFPADYVEEWGRKYGNGLGPIPVSEALVNAYDQPIAIHPTKPGEAMHPLCACKAQVDLVEITEEEYNSNKAIISTDDPDVYDRATLMRAKQTLKSPKMASMYPDLHQRMVKQAS